MKGTRIQMNFTVFYFVILVKTVRPVSVMKGGVKICWRESPILEFEIAG